MVDARSKIEAESSVVARVPGRCGLQACTRTVQWRGLRKVCPTSPNTPWFLRGKGTERRAAKVEIVRSGTVRQVQAWSFVARWDTPLSAGSPYGIRN